jgi:hypothetical protein
MTDDDFKDLTSRLRTNKRKPSTKLECLKLIKQLLKLIVGDLLLCVKMEKQKDSKRKKYYVGGIAQYIFKSYLAIMKYSIRDVKNIDIDILDNFMNIEDNKETDDIIDTDDDDDIVNNDILEIQSNKRQIYEPPLIEGDELHNIKEYLKCRESRE